MELALIASILAVVLWTSSELAAPSVINAVVGDASFVETFGRAPRASDDLDPDLRVRVHLRWITARLRGRADLPLDDVTRRRRARLLDALDAYTDAGRFPTNRHYVGHRPRFTDDGGNVCAVGHLLTITLGREVTDEVARAHEYDFLLDIDEPVLTRFARWAGFSLRELAAIQPAYGPPLAEDAEAAFRAGRYEEALTLFERAYALNPRPRFLFNIGITAERAGQYARALEAFRRLESEHLDTRVRVETAVHIADLEARLAREAASPRTVPATSRGCACGVGTRQHPLRTYSALGGPMVVAAWLSRRYLRRRRSPRASA